ncbi:MAG: hypothetical protein ABI787_02470 [Spartobacteria bacterium]
MIRLLLVLSCSALAWPGLLRAAPPNEPEVARLYARGLAGDEQAVIDCIAAIEETLATKPNDQLARVYLGSAYTLRSRDLGFGKAKLDTLRKGIALMDAAVTGAPNDANVQLTRAVTTQALPGFLGRRKIALTQLNNLVALVEKDPAKLKPDDRQLLYLNAGEAAKAAGEKERALELWRRGAALQADPKLTQEIEAARARP